MSIVSRFLIALVVMWGVVALGGLIGFFTYLLRERNVARAARTGSARPTNASQRTTIAADR